MIDSARDSSQYPLLGTKKYQGQELPLYRGPHWRNTVEIARERFVGRPVHGLIPALFQSSAVPPGKHPRGFVRNSRDDPRNCPLWHPDDLTEWVDRREVEASARKVCERFRPKPTAAELALQSELARNQIKDHRRAAIAYADSDATLTRNTLRDLERKGHHGRIAASLFRVQKSSSRAKRYRGGYTDLAYDRKGGALKALCRTLIEDSAGIRWGWGIDGKADFAEHVLYMDIPTGQVSFHSIERFDGPDYPGRWDGVQNVSHVRILLWCDHLLSSAPDVPCSPKKPAVSAKRAPRLRWTPERAAGIELPSGKHQGKLLGDVIKSDREYIAWITENVSGSRWKDVRKAAQVLLSPAAKDGTIP